MPNILHRLTIDAAPERVHELVASTAGIARWWTGRPVTGEAAVGDRIAVYFNDQTRAAAVFEILECAPERIVWSCVEGPREWRGTRVSFGLTPRDDGGTTLLFHHEGWKEENEFMNGCSTNWAAYLMSLKSGAEGNGFNAYPAGEISRWD